MKISRSTSLALLVLLLILAAACPAQAARIMGKPLFPDARDYQAMEDEARPAQQTIRANAGTKLRRGFLNGVFGWTEVFIWTSEGVISSHATRETSVGFFQGVARGVARTLLGAWDIATFIIPPYDGPAMVPETPFGNLRN